MPYDGMRGLMLGEAIISGRLRDVRELLDVAQINDPIESSFGSYRALHLAASYGQVEVCQFLLENGADPAIAADVRVFTPLHCALERASTTAEAVAKARCCELLLAAGAPVNACARGESTPLHSAIFLIVADPMRSFSGDVSSPISQEAMKIIAMLLKHGADPSVTPDMPPADLRAYLTPLQVVIEKNMEPLLRLLIETCNIDFGQRTAGGRTLLQLAKKQATRDLLRSTKVVRQVRDALETAPVPDVGPKIPSMSPL